MKRLRALIKKEGKQALRDPTTLLIAFILPPLFLFLFAVAVSLDVKNTAFGVVLEGDGVHSHSLANAYGATHYLDTRLYRHRNAVEPLLVSGKLRGFVVIPQDFDRQMNNPAAIPEVQIISDGSMPNSANFVAGYAQGVFNNWLLSQGRAAQMAGRVEIEQRFWFNPELDSSRILSPGAIALAMTMIGTMLTSMVIAREWERGTMEALLSTPVTIGEILLSKLLPYFLLGMTSILGCIFITAVVFNIPLQGSVLAIMAVSSIFMLPALGQGLMISTLMKDQFSAAELGLITGFLPALLLSGFVFEIQGMPWLIQLITTVVPARYYVSSLQTIYLAGDIWPALILNMMAMLTVASVFFTVIILKSRKRLD